jgi:hypothetical protein
MPHVLVELSSPQGDPAGVSRYPERGLHQISEGIKQRKHAKKCKKIGAHRDRKHQTCTPKFDSTGQKPRGDTKSQGGKKTYIDKCVIRTRPRRDFLSSFLVRVAGKRVDHSANLPFGLAENCLFDFKNMQRVRLCDS